MIHTIIAMRSAGWLVVDAPKISCYSSEALIGDKNVHLSCVIRAKPRLSALFWIIDNNGTALAEGGQIINGHWTLVMVRRPDSRAILVHVLCLYKDLEVVYGSHNHNHNQSHNYEASSATWDHTVSPTAVLLDTRVNALRQLTSCRQVGTRLTYLGGMKG